MGHWGNYFFPVVFTGESLKKKKKGKQKNPSPHFKDTMPETSESKCSFAALM